MAKGNGYDAHAHMADEVGIATIVTSVAEPPIRRPAPLASSPFAVQNPPKISVLGPTLHFKGELRAQEDLLVRGSVDGAMIHSQTLTIGVDGSMHGDIHARVIVIEGTVDGNLFATDSVSVRASAKVRGNIFAPHISIMEGAFFQGQIQMEPPEIIPHEPVAQMRPPAPRESASARHSASAPVRDHHRKSAERVLTGS